MDAVAVAQQQRSSSSGAAAAASSSSAVAVAAGGGQRVPLQLLVYVDKDQFPQKLALEVVDFADLARNLQKTVGGQSIGAVSCWDDDFKQYVPIRSIEPLQRAGGRGKLWVETSGCKVNELIEDRDPLEYAALREHIDRLSPPREGAVYHMTSAHRVSLPQAEDTFKTKRKHLVEPAARTQMLFYTNNARPSDQVVQHGFALPAGGGGIVFSSDIDAQPALNANIKFLLCEVAVGKPVTVHQNLGERVPFGSTFDTTRYDSLLHVTQRSNGLSRLEEVVVFDAQQAVPRYIITCSVTKAARRPMWQSAAAGCDVHPGETMKLWCVTCRQLMCPYCMTIGAHRGHDGRDISEVAMFERQIVLRMFATLEKTLARRQSEVADLERVRSEVSAAARHGEETIRQTISDLHHQLRNAEQQLLVNLDGKRSCALRDVDKVVAVVQQLCADLQKKVTSTREFLELPVDTHQQARMEFLGSLQRVLDVLKDDPPYDDPSLTDVSFPPLQTNVLIDDAKQGIDAIAIADGPVEGSGAMAGGATSASSSVPKAALEGELARLRDLEAGYIWVIPEAAKHFSAGQTKDVFSDVFQLLGAQWELRITSQPEGHVSVFVHAVEHTHRMDFKVILFSPKGWHVRGARNWLETFRGKGWGVKPYIEKQLVLQQFVVDNTLKVCIAPTSGLY